MVGLRVWLLRCSAAKAAPFLVGVSITLVAARTGWDREWRWAFGWAAITCYLTVPAVAGLVAFDRSRRVEPTLSVLGKSGQRGLRSMLALVAASWLWMMVVWCATLTFVAVRAQLADAVASPDLWSFVIPPAVLLAGAAVGLLCGSLLPNMAAGPVAALVAYISSMTPGLGGLGLPQLLTADASTGTRLGLEHSPRYAATQIVVQLLVVLACVLWVARSAALTTGWKRASGAAVVLAALLALIGVRTATANVELWRVADRPQRCIGSEVVVCGPAEAGRLLTAAHSSLTEATQLLGSSGLDLQTRYVFAPGRSLTPADSGVLTLQPENVPGARIATSDVIATLQTPRLCAAFFAAEPPLDLMTNQREVQGWLATHLRGQVPVPAAPPEVVQAYEQLRSCEPAVHVRRGAA